MAADLQEISDNDTDDEGDNDDDNDNSTGQQRKEVNHTGAGGISLREERGHRGQLHRDRAVGGGSPGHGRVGLSLDVCQ